MVYITVRTAS